MGVIGAGKSLQGRLLAKDDGYTWISTGEILRHDLSEEETDKMKKGKLYSDEEVIKVIDKTLNKIDMRDEIIFDGFPRTIKQADWLMDQVKADRLDLTAVFNLQATDDVVARRLKERGRIDDTDEGISARMNEYKTKTLPMINYFKKTGVKIINIDSNQTPEQVHEQIKDHLK
jgi:adenylate kinase